MSQAQTIISIISNDTSSSKSIAGFDLTGINRNDSITEFSINVTEPNYLYVSLDEHTKFHCRLWIDEYTKHRTIHVNYKTQTATIDFSALDNENKFIDSCEQLFYYNKIDLRTLDSFKVSYIEKHKTSYLSLFYLSHILDRTDISVTEKLFNPLTLNKQTLNYSTYRNAKAYLESHKRPIKKIAFLNDSLYDFDGYTKSDSIVHTFSLKSKYILLYFWFTSCKPCKTSTSYLQTFSNKYSDSLDISVVSFSIDEPNYIQKWKQSVHYVDSKWIDVTDKMGTYGSICNVYDVKSAPTLLLFENRLFKAKFTDVSEIQNLERFIK
jgi:cytochrome oxidase Cu insertion factor (SCO1/SenC/PrrC family)